MAKQYSVELWFNGEAKFKDLFSGTKAACEEYARSRDYLKPPGHIYMCVKGNQTSKVEAETRTVKPMGWGFKANWEDKPGRKATNLTVYAPKPAFRRV